MSEPAEVGGDDADALAQTKGLDHLFGGRNGHAPPRRDADARKLLRLLFRLGLGAQHRQAVEHQRRGIVDPHLVGGLALDRRAPLYWARTSRLRTPSANASPNFAASNFSVPAGSGNENLPKGTHLAADPSLLTT